MLISAHYRECIKNINKEYFDDVINSIKQYNIYEQLRDQIKEQQRILNLMYDDQIERLHDSKICSLFIK